MLRSSALLLALALAPLGLQAATSTSGEMKLWHKVTVNLAGPSSSETGATNPFRDIRLDVTFTAPDGTKRTVPGYFAADGNAGETSATSGTVWRAHLTPDQTGTWSYTISLKTGAKVAINGGGTSAGGDDGASSTFVIGASNKTGADFRAPDKGKLEYVGEHALRWKGGGGRFFKTAMNHPETFLEYQDFDNTNSTRTYPNHVTNWASGDPTWKSGKGKGIIGVVNYLASQGVNEHYFVTMNSRGDGEKAFPWTASEAIWNYDVSKLAQWGVVFDHMMRKGVLAQFVLDECENQMLFEVLEGTAPGGIADSRKLYYREMAARFGYLNALIWNVGEENGWDRSGAGAGPSGAATSDAQRKSRAAFLRGLLSPQAHIVVHNGPSGNDAIFTNLLGDAGYSGISYQGSLSNTGHGNGRLGYWHAESRKADRPWVIAYDEPYLGGTPTRDQWRTNALWASMIAGGNGAGIYSSSDRSLQDYTTYAAHFGDMRRIQTFLSTNAVPYWEMVPSNSLVSAGWCLAKAGSFYVVYLPSGGTANITVPAGTYTVDWFDPRNNAALVRTANLVSTGTAKSIGGPPSNTTLDWAVLIRNTAIFTNVAPTVSAGPDRNITLPSTASLNGTVTDDGLPTGTLTYSWTKVSGPGTVTFANSTAVDTTASFSVAGTYVLRLTASDGALSANDSATVVVAAASVNAAPIVSAGPDRSITLPSTASLDGTVSDDGLPTPSALTYSWTRVSGPGTVTFANSTAVDTTASFSVAGVYVLRLTARDGSLSTSDDTQVTVAASTLPTVIDYTLIDADTDLPVVGLEHLVGKVTLALDDLPPNLALRANVANTVGSVRFGLDGNATYRTENSAPFAVFGDTAGDYRPWNLTLGLHAITATPFSGTNASGTAGSATLLNLTLMTAPVAVN